MEDNAFEHLEGDGEKLSQRLSRSLGSPFGTWSDPVNRSVAIAMLSVFGVIFLTGLIGHACVVAYSATSRKAYSTSRRGALLILANLSTSHMLFLLCCLPSIAYKSIMNLTYGPWILGDVVCRVVPFLELFVLGVTVLSFCVLSVDRFRSARQISKAYEEAGDSCLTGICKIVVIWLGALLIASPEIFVNRTTVYQEKIPQNIYEKIEEKDPQLVMGIYPRYQKLENPEENWKALSPFFREIGLRDVDAPEVDMVNVTTFAVTYQYEKCEPKLSLWKDAPQFLVIFVGIYSRARQWWLFGFYFCLPVFFSLLFAMLVARRLTCIHDKCVKEFGQYPVDAAGGTMNSHRGGSLNRSNSLASNQTASSEAQNLMAADGRSPGTPRADNPRGNFPSAHRGNNAYPAMMTPMIVRATNSPLISPNEGNPPYNGSVLSSPSMTSAPIDGNLGNGKTSSLPPHGRGSRGRSRMQRHIFHNVARDRALNTLLVALILAFSLTWLPQHIFDILFTKTQLDDALEKQYVILILDVCRYFSALAFAVNPIVIYLSYKSYRLFLDKFCCSCSCCCCK